MDNPATFFAAVPVMVVAVRTGLWLERRVHHFRQCAEPCNHLPQHIVIRDTHPLLAHLQRHVAITEVISNTNKVHFATTGNMQHPLGLRPNDNNPAIFGLQEIAVAQNVPTLEEQSNLFATGQRCAQPAFLSQVEGQHQFEIKAWLFWQQF